MFHVSKVQCTLKMRQDYLFIDKEVSFHVCLPDCDCLLCLFSGMSSTGPVVKTLPLPQIKKQHACPLKACPDMTQQNHGIFLMMS